MKHHPASRRLFPSLGLALGLCVFGGLSASAVRAQQDDAVFRLDAAFTQALARVEAPLTELKAKYAQSLDNWLRQAQTRGDLEGVLAARKEVESLSVPGPRQFDAWPELKRLREIYETTETRLREQTRAERQKLHETYLRELQAAVERLTKAGSLPQAQAVAARAKQVETLMVLDKAAAGGGAAAERTGSDDLKVLWEFKSRASAEPVKECELKVSKAGMELTSRHVAGSNYASRRTFKPPFRIQARVSTDSSNIRFYFDRSMLAIFNWEVNPRELRVREPRTGIDTGFGGKGELTVKQMHDIEIDLIDDRIIIRANGAELVNYAARSEGKEGPIGIGPAYGSLVTVEKFRVLSLESLAKGTSPAGP